MDPANQPGVLGFAYVALTGGGAIDSGASSFTGVITALEYTGVGQIRIWHEFAFDPGRLLGFSVINLSDGTLKLIHSIDQGSSDEFVTVYWFDLSGVATDPSKFVFSILPT